MRDRFFEVQNCDRCGKSLNGCRIQSMYNEDVLCMDCAEILRGNYNFAGIGLKMR